MRGFFCKVLAGLCLFFFFFSSRRRHTRCSRDWSSDVCSSDLLRLRLGSCRAVDGFLTVFAQRRRAGRGLHPSAGLVLGHGDLLRHSRLRAARSEEHTSELQSRLHLVCRLLLEKKKTSSSFRSLSTKSISPTSHCCPRPSAPS